jgi:hypothetical protein
VIQRRFFTQAQKISHHVERPFLDFDASDVKGESFWLAWLRWSSRPGYPAAPSILEITLSLASRPLFVVVGRRLYRMTLAPRILPNLA